MIKWMLIYILTLLGNVDLYLQLKFRESYFPDAEGYRPLDFQNYDHNRVIIKEFLKFMDAKRGLSRLSAMRQNARAPRGKKSIKRLDRTNLQFRLLDGETRHKDWRELMRYLRVRDLANMLRICHPPRRNKDRLSFSLGLLCLGRKSRNFQLLKRELGLPPVRVWICKDEIEGLFKFQLRKPDDYERIGKKTFQAFKKKRSKKKVEEICREQRERVGRQREMMQNLTAKRGSPLVSLEVDPRVSKFKISIQSMKPEGLLLESQNDVFIDDGGCGSELQNGKDLLYSSDAMGLEIQRPMVINIDPQRSEVSNQSARRPSDTPILNLQSSNNPIEMNRFASRESMGGSPGDSGKLTESEELYDFLVAGFIPFYVENNLTDKVLEKYCENSSYIPDFLCINRNPGDNRGPKGTYLFQYVILSQYYSMEKHKSDLLGEIDKEKGKEQRKKGTGRRRSKGKGRRGKK